MRAIHRATTSEAGALPFPARLPARLSSALGLALAAWFSFALAAQAADSSSLAAGSTNSLKGLAETNALRRATNALPASSSTGAETRPLTPREWLQRNFLERTDKPAGQARTLTTELPRAPQNTKSNLPAKPVKTKPCPGDPAVQTAYSPPQSNPPTPAANPKVEPNLSTQAAAYAPSNTKATEALKAGFITGMDALDDKHRLAIGDRLSFRIVEDQVDPKLPLDPKPLTVTDSGEIEVPYIGRFPAENKTCRQLAGEVKAALEKDYYYQATVIIAIDLMTKSRGRVYLVGPVHVPGPQEVPSDEVLTLSRAITRAGGFTDYADRQHVKVTRNGGKGEGEKQTFTVDVAQILDKGKTEQDVPLLPGDLVVIPERLIRF
jgi:protein involved in polysaccharide export with SLBB domain